VYNHKKGVNMDTPISLDENNPVTLMVAIVQSQDVDSANNALTQLGLSTTRLPSIGGFLGQRNATLLIAVPNDKADIANEALHKNCRQRVEFITVPLESSPLPIPAPTPVTIGGATIFSLEVDHFEEY
jgi:uncharacterized protein YaaQ